MKKCFKCLVEKPLDAFYKHPEMKDGHLNKCIECNKRDTKTHSLKLAYTDPDYTEKERTRGRKKYHRLYSGQSKVNPIAMANWEDKFPEKVAVLKKRYKIERRDGLEFHHWSYCIEHAEDIIYLTKKDHKKAHRFLVYDQERCMYRRYDTLELLDTKEKHSDFIIHCIQNKED